MNLTCRAALLAGLAVLSSACAESEAATHDHEPPRRARAFAAAAEQDTSGATSAPAITEAPITDAPPAGAGASSTTARTPECPAGMARIDRFCIDRYEAHLIVRGPGGGITRHPYFERPREGVTYEARSEAGVLPQAYVSRVESEAACSAAEKRLCSRREWQRACKGGQGTTYPYGRRHEAGRCNTGKPHLLTLRFGADSRRWAYAQFNDPELDQEPGFLAKAGENEGCASDAGVFDLVGNLHEWVSDTADGMLKAHLDTEGIPRAFQYWSPGNGVFMGGFFSTGGELGPGCEFTTIAHEPRYHDYSTGFRCCADAAAE